MADVNIGAKITVDTGEGAKSIAEMQTNIKGLSTEMKNAKVGSDEYKEASDKLAQAQKELNESTKAKTTTFEDLKTQLAGTVPALEGAAGGVAGLGKQLWALAANPIVLIVVGIVAALKFHYDAFTYSVAGGKQMAQMFAGLKASIDVIIDRIMKAGQGIIKFFSGDWKGASKDMKEAFTGIGASVGAAYDVVKKATAALQELDKAQREASVARAAQNAAIIKSKELLNDETASIKDRTAALKLVSAIERKIGEEDIEFAKQRLEHSKKQWGQTEEGLKKHAQELADLRIDISNKEAETARHELQLQRQTRTLGKQEKAEAKAEEDAVKAKKKEERDALVEYTNKLLKLQQENELAILRDGYEKESQIAKNKYAEEKRALELSLADKKITREQFNKLSQATSENYRLTQESIDDKHKKDEKTKEESFEKELLAITSKTKLDGITDVRIKEKIAIEESYQIKREQVLANEKLTANQRSILLAALAEEAAQQQKQLAAKFDAEDKTKGIKAQKDNLKAEYDLKVAMKLKTYQLELEYYNKTRALDREDLINKKASAKELEAFDIQTSAGKIALDNAESDEKIKNAQTVANTLTSLSSLVGQQTALGKGLAVAASIINTYQGATKALAQGGIFGAVGAAGIIATGLSSVNKIVSTNIPGQSSTSGVSGTSLTAPTTAPLTPQSATTALNQSSINAIGNAATGRNYVLDSDIRNNQERFARLSRAARLG